MTPDQWARVKDLFDQAAELTPPERAQLLRSSGDAVIAAEVERLLLHHDKTHVAVDQPAGRGFGELLNAMAPTVVVPPGNRVLAGRFRLIRQLGQGGMGEVFEAEDAELRQRVALKTIRPHLTAEPKIQQRFREEIALARRVNHPNVCRLFDLGRDGDTVFYTMELVGGETLSQRIRRGGALGLEEAAEIARQVAEGLAAAHGLGIIHRDLKPANVMLSGSRAVVMDFGLAKIFGEESVAGQSTSIAIGTPVYMAPEQIEGGKIGPAADIYAFGVLLCEMVTGQTPFAGESPLAIAVKKVRTDPAELLAGVTDARWRSVIERCLQVKPEDRFADVREIPAALGAATPVPRYTTAPAPFFRRRRQWITGAALATVALVAAFGIWRFRHSAYRANERAAHFYEQGVHAAGQESWLRARNYFEEAVKADPAFAVGHARLAEANIELDALDVARTEMLRVNELAPAGQGLAPADQELVAGLQSALQFDYAAALPRLRQRTSLVPAAERPAALMDLARVMERAPAHLRKDAPGLYREALQADPDRAPAHLRLGVLTSSEASFTEAERLYRRDVNAEGLAQVELERAALASRTKKMDEARKHAEAAVRLAEDNHNEAQLIAAQLRLAAIALLQGRIDESEKLRQSSMTLARAQGLETLWVRGLNDLGSGLLTQLKVKDAQQMLEESLALARRTRSRVGEGTALSLLGNTLCYGDATEAGTRYAEQARDLWKELGDPSRLMSVHRTLFGCYGNAQRLAESTAAAAEAQRLAIQLGSPTAQAEALRLEADGLAAEGKLRQAAEARGKAAALFAAMGNPVSQAYDLTNQADQLWRVGQYAEADRLLEQAEKLARSLPRPDPGFVDRWRVVSAESQLSRLRCAQAKAVIGPAVNPADSTKRQLRIRIIAAQCEACLGAPREALAALRALEPVDPGYRVYLQIAAAEAALAAGDSRGAARQLVTPFDAAVKAPPERALVHRLLQRKAALAMGDAAGAERLQAAIVEGARALGFQPETDFGGRPDLRSFYAAKH